MFVVCSTSSKEGQMRIIGTTDDCDKAVGYAITDFNTTKKVIEDNAYCNILSCEIMQESKNLTGVKAGISVNSLYCCIHFEEKERETIDDHEQNEPQRYDYYWYIVETKNLDKKGK